MATPNKLGISFTDLEIDAMKDAARVISDTIEAKIILNLSEEERKTLSKIGPERLPYALVSVKDFAADFPQFNPIAFPLTDAVNDFQTWGKLNEVLILLNESRERAEELAMVASHFSWKFTLGQYANAERNLAENVTGAQTVYDGLKGAFEGQGPQGGTPATP